jgi:hypothetical protein
MQGVFDASGCEGYEKTQCQKNVAEVRANAMTFEPDKVPVCLGKLEQHAKDCEPSWAEEGDLLDLRQCRFFVGTLPPGKTCERDEQCGSGDGASVGVCAGSLDAPSCVVFAFVGEGSTCSNGTFVQTPFYECSGDTQCVISVPGEAGICTKITPLGQACDPVADLLACGEDAYCKDGRCAPLEPGGTPCADLLSCRSFVCTGGLCEPFRRFTGEECTGKK